jgi:hypothetical protein
MKTTETKDSTAFALPYREKVKMVKDRLQALRYPVVNDLPKSVKVRNAEKVLAEWDKANEGYRLQQRQDRRKLHNDICDALCLGDMHKAVTLMREAELGPAPK